MLWAAAVSKTLRPPTSFVEEKAQIMAKICVDKILTPMLNSAKDYFGADT